jgi:hypothetical protein
MSAHCWICIVIDHHVNIAAKQCFSCNNLVCYLSMWGADIGVAWLSSIESFDQGCLIGAAEG